MVALHYSTNPGSVQRHLAAPNNPYSYSLFTNFTSRRKGLLPYSPTTLIIPSQNKSRRPANIPLRTLSNRIDNEHSEALLSSRSNEKQGRRSSSTSSRSSHGSESSWSDTGDLAEQLADAEDPLQIKLRESLDDQIFRGSSSRRTKHKKVRYHSDVEHREEKGEHPGIVKEDIEIPEPAPRHISRVEHLLAAIMSGGERQMRGLTGKSLVYVSPA